MARNVEIKARVTDLPELARLTAAMSQRDPIEIDQDDTFFHCQQGRLKLRTIAPDRGELIFYQRADAAGPSTSFYVRTAVPAPDSMREVLSLAYGIAGRVIKHRTLYLIGRTRVHLDRVKGLGDFMELEVVLADDEDERDARREALDLARGLGIDDHSLVHCAYVDLLVNSAS